MSAETYLIGYARVAKGDEQSNAAQSAALARAGRRRVFEETASWLVSRENAILSQWALCPGR